LGTNNKNFKVKNGLDVGGSADVTGDATIAGKLSVTASSGDEGGEILLAKPATNTNLVGTGVTVDVYQNKLRFFEQGGDARGYYVDITGGGSGAGTNLVGGGSASNSFTTINVPNGTDPAADSSTDTLNLADGANITITGDSSTDTVTVAVDADLTGITSILTPNYIGLDTTPTGVPGTQGTLAWNPDQETLDIQLDTNVVLPVGQKHVIRVKNNSGSVAIPKGRVVSFAGATGDTVTVAPAISTSTYEPYTLVGVTSEEIPADGFGFVTQYGFVRGIDTNSFTLGDLLYVDPASPGVLTKVLPTAPNWTFPIAAVTKVNASSGIILVRIIPGSHLHDVVDVAITSPTNNQILTYDDATDVWKNTDIPSLTLQQTISTPGTQSVDLTGAPEIVFAVVVGGGGGGGNGVGTTYFAGGGGGGGAVVSGWVPAQNTCFIGTGGTGGTSAVNATDGGSTTYSGLYANGGAAGARNGIGSSSSFGAGAGGGGENTTNGTQAGGVGSVLGYSVGGSGGVATSATATGTGGAGSAGTSGGGGGAYVVTTTAAASATGGAGGNGMTGGGGGGATSNVASATGQAQGGAGGSGAGGAGGTATATTGTATGKQSSGGGGGGYLGAGGNGTAGTGTTARSGGAGGSGGGGGGASTSEATGGAGGNGCVLIYW
jgi:hypothetical protein